MNVVFTGRGHLDGNHVQRAGWYRIASQNGFVVQDSVDYSTEVLVASRADTSKAQAARDIGIPVITYEQFSTMIRTYDVRNSPTAVRERIREYNEANQQGPSANRVPDVVPDYILPARLSPGSTRPEGVAPARHKPVQRDPVSPLAMTGKRRLDLDD